MIKITTDLELYEAKMPNAKLDRMAKFFDDEHKAFVKNSIIVHRRTVFEILVRLIRLCNVDTGRLRGSWTPMMDQAGYTAYQQFLALPPMEGSKAGGVKLDEAAVGQGRALGFFVDHALDTTVGSNVVYGPDVNARSSFLTKALIWGENRYRQNFDRFFETAERKGWIPPQSLTGPVEGS